MSYDTRRVGGGDFVPPVEERMSPRPQMRPVPERGDFRNGEAAASAIAAVNGEAISHPGDDVEVTFSRTYEAYGEPVRSIKLRRPTTLELRKCGYPMRSLINPNTQEMDGLDFKPDAIAKYIQLLSSPPLPPSTIDTIELDDFELCSKAVVSFFLK